MTFRFDTGSISVVFGRKWAPWKNCWWKLQEYRQTSADSTYYYIITWAYNRQWSKHYKYRIKGKMRCFITKIAFIKEVNWASWRETYRFCPGSLQCWPCTPPWVYLQHISDGRCRLVCVLVNKRFQETRHISCTLANTKLQQHQWACSSVDHCHPRTQKFK